MKWSLQQLYRYQETPLEFSGTVSYDEYIKDFSDILHMDEVKYSGNALMVSPDKYRFNIHIETVMYLEDARTLDEVEFPISLDVLEVFEKKSNYSKTDLDDDNDNRFIEKNTIDLYDVIWENIILEKPIRIVKES